jgi:hypothetical protein
LRRLIRWIKPSVAFGILLEKFGLLFWFVGIWQLNDQVLLCVGGETEKLFLSEEDFAAFQPSVYYTRVASLKRHCLLKLATWTDNFDSETTRLSQLQRAKRFQSPLD